MLRCILFVFVFGLGIAAADALHSSAPAAQTFPTPPPVPPTRPVAETRYGTSVTDPYRYFENMKDPVVIDFFKAQNAYARAVLSRLGSAREQLFDRIRVLDNTGASVSGVTIDGPYYFYQKLNPGDNSPKLYVRDISGGPERVLVDPQALAAAGKHYTIDYFLPSLDGSRVAYGISEGGSEAAVIHVVDTATGDVLPDAIDRAYYFGVTSWLSDNKSFYYVRFPKLKPGESENDKETRAVAYLHLLGRDPDSDSPVFGYGVNPKVPFGLTDFPIVVYSPVSNYTVAVVGHGVQNERSIYAAQGVIGATTQWESVATTADDVTGYDLKGSTIYLLTHENAPSFKIVARTLAAPNLTAARDVIPASRAVIEDLAVASDGLYVLSRDGGFGRITRVALSADGTPGSTTNVTLPFEGSINAIATDPRVAGAVFGLTGWTHSLLYYAVDAQGNVTDTHLKEIANVDTSPYTSSEVQARSADGTMVPLSIVYRKGLALDGSHPAYLEGYGAYGIELNPAFSATRIAWLERGGVFAVCHPRGGGWYGEAWHQAGMITTKPHTWQDFIACGQWLVAHKYTSRAHLAGEGTSAGGITIGRAITTDPHLFAAALDVVGASNALRQEFSPNGPPNTPEFGTVKNEVGFKALYAMDAYEHVVPGTPYPAVMLITGYNDPRVSSWELAKMTARLQKATTSGRPILLRVDYDAGHGFLAASRAQSEQLLTDEYAFLLWQCGDPAFRGIPTRIFPRQ
ncbi:MAG: S9 family peptidase [Candidatus Eremiobacteraeota bacterium]|nr:S9 family peptidase [Candidatus Eremiobacteraeota bacterium]MBV8499953.1 S9 family peptidase [Candidatus Eremiobacteraeota bacterium]